jgi:hypothetical protein
MRNSYSRSSPVLVRSLAYETGAIAIPESAPDRIGLGKIETS